MQLQSVRTPFRVNRPAPVSAEPRVAVLLNSNARKVTAKVIRALSHVVPAEDLFVSRSEMDARRIAQTVLERRYHTVFCGGGDGTFMSFANELLNQVDQRRHPRSALPRFGVLKLGTGNGLAALVNASPLRGDGILDDVLRARASEVPNYRTLDLLKVDGKYTQFSGMGVDGKVLNDYIWVKETLGRGVLKKVMTGEGGYFMSVVCKTVPHYFTHSSFVNAEAVNSGTRPAYRLGAQGEVVEEIAPGGVMYRGPVMMAAASTIPFYGFEFKMFPFAGQRPGMMHLRLGAIPTPQVLMHLPQLWKGTFFHTEQVMDFHAQDVKMRFERAMPFQVGGDAAGYRDHAHFQVASQQVELVDFHGTVN